MSGQNDDLFCKDAYQPAEDSDRLTVVLYERVRRSSRAGSR
jgi:hypothetical protein